MVIVLPSASLNLSLKQRVALWVLKRIVGGKGKKPGRIFMKTQEGVTHYAKRAALTRLQCRTFKTSSAVEVLKCFMSDWRHSITTSNVDPLSTMASICSESFPRPSSIGFAAASGNGNGVVYAVLETPVEEAAEAECCQGREPAEAEAAWTVEIEMFARYVEAHQILGWTNHS